MSLELKDFRGKVTVETDVAHGELLPTLKAPPLYRGDGLTWDDWRAGNRPEADGVTITLRPETAALVAYRAFAEDRTPAYFVERLIHQWAEREIKSALGAYEALKNPSTDDGKESRGETSLRHRLLDELEAVGIDARGEVATSNGNADIVIYVDDAPHVVVELKPSLRSKRDTMQASGQAQAYAAALGAQVALVCAETVDPHAARPGAGIARVVLAENLVAEVQTLLRGQT
jgi:hypothetical protein